MKLPFSMKHQQAAEARLEPILSMIFVFVVLPFTHTSAYRIALPPSQGTKQGICWMFIDFIRCRSPISLSTLLNILFFHFPSKAMQENIKKTFFYISESREFFQHKRDEIEVKSSNQRSIKTIFLLFTKSGNQRKNL